MVFADTAFWVALLNKSDDLHDKAKNAFTALGNVRLITTDFVLNETLNFFSAYGPALRQATAKLASGLLNNANVEVVPATRDLVRAGIDLFEKRLDKGYSHTDCISMVILQQRQISEILTQDHHFAQEGYTLLI